MKYGLSPETIEAICSVFAKHTNIEKAILYGSRAKGSFRNGSDIDLVLVGSKLLLTEQLVIENEIDDLFLPYKIDLSIFHQISNKELVAHIDRVGKLFYQS
ncbi:MAG TPA: nucleotidyltransferase domain-containing protein [Flavipsychrobacter sp.]|nr:nucleotidyltransferase domain-containing protein [Flavipsychrobacter sp.]